MFSTNNMKFLSIAVALLVVAMVIYLSKTKESEGVAVKPVHTSQKPLTLEVKENEQKESTVTTKKPSLTKPVKATGTVLDDGELEEDNTYNPEEALASSEPISTDEMDENEADMLKELTNNKDEGGESYEEEETDIVKVKRETKEEVYERLSTPLTEEALTKIEETQGLMNTSSDDNTPLETKDFDPDKL